MPGEFSTPGANSALDAVTGRATASAATRYLALLTAAPTDATTPGTMTEVFAPGTNGYARQAVAWTAPAGDPSQSGNSATLTFGPFTGDPAPVTHCALVSSATATTGTLYAWWALNTPRDAAVGDSITFAAGDLTLSCD